MFKSDGCRGIDINAWKDCVVIELWEDNAGGLLITQDGEKMGFDATNLPDGQFEPDAVSLLWPGLMHTVKVGIQMVLLTQ